MAKEKGTESVCLCDKRERREEMWTHRFHASAPLTLMPVLPFPSSFNLICLIFLIKF